MLAAVLAPIWGRYRKPTATWAHAPPFAANVGLTLRASRVRSLKISIMPPIPCYGSFDMDFRLDIAKNGDDRLGRSRDHMAWRNVRKCLRESLWNQQLFLGFRKVCSCSTCKIPAIHHFFIRLCLSTPRFRQCW